MKSTDLPLVDPAELHRQRQRPEPNLPAWATPLVLGLCLGLIVLSLAWELWLAPLRPGGSWLALKAVPLLPALYGVWRRRLYTYRWLSLLVWLYLLEGLVRATSDKGSSQQLAMLETALATLLFAAVALAIRHVNQHRRLASNSEQPT